MSANYSKTIALTAVVQAAKQVQNIARHNAVDETSLQCNITSIFAFDSNCVDEIFSDEENRLTGLRVGLQQTVHMLNVNGSDAVDRECWRYTLLLLQLGKKLMDDNSRSRRLGQLLHSFHSQHEMYRFESDYFEGLASVYQSVVSKMTPQIMIYGEHGYLQQTNNPEKVRCLLLSGIRASFLWWQLGGQRWKLLLPGERKNYAANAQQVLLHI